MDPRKLPAEAVPLQNMHETVSGQSTVVHHTTVNITNDPPKDYIVWSLCNFFYGNPFCLGLAAIVFSFKARDRKVAGDLNGASHYASTALCLNTTSTILITIFGLTCVTMVIIFLVNVQNFIDSMPKQRSRYWYD